MLYFAGGGTAMVSWLTTNLPTLIGATVLYSTAYELIFSTPRVPSHVIRLSLSSTYGSIVWYLGDTWTSTTSITNSVTLDSGGSTNSIVEMDVIVTPDLFMFVYKNAFPAYIYLTFGSLSNGNLFVMCGRRNQGGTFITKNITANTSLNPNSYGMTIASATGYYYKTDLYMMNGNQLVGTVNGMKALAMVRPDVTSSILYTAVGNDIVVSHYLTASGTEAVPGYQIIVDGNI